MANRYSMGAFSPVMDERVVLAGLTAGAVLAILGVIPPRCVACDYRSSNRRGPIDRPGSLSAGKVEQTNYRRGS
jgi:hypothetical protein